LEIRQRLPLAMAIIHEPELLILDEPTSGVDPVARDSFWSVLVELSLRDRVTIFISTNFMNEALRCDRISLMHEGRVLVANESQKLVEQKNALNLESAFISNIEDHITAQEQRPADTHSEAQALLGDDGGSTSSSVADTSFLSFNLRRVLALSHREMAEVIRDPVRSAFSLLGSMLLLLMIAYGVSHDVDDLRFAALDLDQSVASRDYILHFSGSRYFVETDEVYTRNDLKNGCLLMTSRLTSRFPQALVEM